MFGFPAALTVVAIGLGIAVPACSARPATAVKPAASASAPTRVGAAPLSVRSTPKMADPAAAESQFVVLINQERARRGMHPLAWDPTLRDAARLHSQEMARLGYFDHRSPVSGRETPADRWELAVSRVPDEYTIAENLFYGSVSDVAWGHQSLMESDGHRRNILNPAYNGVGVGVHVDRSGQMWVTEMFITATAPRRVASTSTAF